MQDKPLKGVKVADFTRLFAGPFCTMLLADLGADVVKIEAPEGDPIRHQGPPFYDGKSMGFLAVNRNKRSVVLDAKDPKQLALTRQLAEKADIVVENFRPGVMERMGLGYAELSAKNPRQIYASISGMGATGPLRDKGAFDLTIQAEGGFMSLTGEPDGAPIKLGTSVFDLVCGQYALSAILTALYQRERTGRGSYVETSLFEGLVSYLVDAGLEWLLMGNLRPKWGSEHASNVPYKAFKATDGWIVIGAAVQRLYEALLKVLGRTDLLQDARFTTMKDRVTHRKELYAILDAEVAKWSVAELAAKLDAANVPCAPVNTMEGVFKHPQTLARNMRVEARKQDGTTMPMIGSAIKFRDFDISSEWTAPPALGEHTEEVLSDWLGLAGVK
ncbi:CoA transferase [uncultured Ferrovibrio sp.]|jgi:Predicted acyl-CoA transferases/carnitine dehydratase|uniref:CaiB/BaiF CoA transferase family protein n=1 Tax=uncultured Ferrovibrio sp. TaxID=1576913 RepID=UPI002603C08C|nr:CoA transferase [uncultured Ferrovibrio sp.]